MTSKRSSSTHHTMMSSSTDASASSSRWVYWARPGPILPRSLVSVACSRSPGLGPVDPHRAQVADVEGDRRRGGRPGARRWCPPGRTAASPSRRRAPSWRRAAVGGVERRAAFRLGAPSPRELPGVAARRSGRAGRAGPPSREAAQAAPSSPDMVLGGRRRPLRTVLESELHQEVEVVPLVEDLDLYLRVKLGAGGGPCGSSWSPAAG